MLGGVVGTCWGFQQEPPLCAFAVSEGSSGGIFLLHGDAGKLEVYQFIREKQVISATTFLQVPLATFVS